MKINPNYIALCKQFIIDTKTTRREETKKLHDELLEKIVLFEIADFDKAIKISRRYAKDQNLIQDLIEQRTLFLNSGKAPKKRWCCWKKNWYWIGSSRTSTRGSRTRFKRCS